jgi:hypothetical protein
LDPSANEESALQVPEEEKQGSLPPMDENSSLHDEGRPSPIFFASHDEDERIYVPEHDWDRLELQSLVSQLYETTVII